MEPAVVFGTAAAGKRVFERLIDDLYDAAKGDLQGGFKKLKTKAQIGKLYGRISSLRNVKTIWQIDKAIDLAEFYHPSKVAIDGWPSPRGLYQSLGYTDHAPVPSGGRSGARDERSAACR